MSFCVECGAIVRTFQGLCPKCFAERRKLISPPDFIDVMKCASCSKLLVGKSWVDSDIEDAILPILDKEVKTTRDVTFKTYNFNLKREDERNMRLDVKATFRVDDFEIVREFTSKIRLRGGTCPTCGRRAGFYYEAILQVRADDRKLTTDEEEDITEFVHEAVDRASSSGEAFISKIEPVRGGIDFYLSSHDLGKNLAKSLKNKYGGKVAVSPKLYGRKDGREIFRTTHLIRLPKYRRGDVLRHEGRHFEVLNLGIRPTIRDLVTGESRSVSANEMRKVVIVPSDRYVVEILSVTNKEIEYFDPLDSKTEKISKPPDYKKSKKVKIVRIEKGSFVSMLRKVAGGKIR